MIRTLDQALAALPQAKRRDLEQRGAERLEEYRTLQEPPNDPPREAGGKP